MSSQYAPREAHANCSTKCAEMLGGHCPGETCVYRPSDEEPWHDYDPRLSEREAELRGYLRGQRHVTTECSKARFVGFWLGVLAFFGALFLLALLQWAASA